MFYARHALRCFLTTAWSQLSAIGVALGVLWAASDAMASPAAAATLPTATAPPTAAESTTMPTPNGKLWAFAWCVRAQGEHDYRAARAKLTATFEPMRRRARYAAALPTLKFQVGRVLDAGENLSPTVYDPERKLYSGSIRWLLSIESSFDLAGLAFTPDELAIIKLRDEQIRQLDQQRSDLEDDIQRLLLSASLSHSDTLDPLERAKQLAAWDSARLRFSFLAAHCQLPQDKVEDRPAILSSHPL